VSKDLVFEIAATPLRMGFCGRTTRVAGSCPIATCPTSSLQLAAPAPRSRRRALAER
jgi:hypothetical protein